MTNQNDLKTKSAISNLKHDLMLADIYKYLISDEKSLWCQIDNRERFLFHCPESWQGKDVVCHWGPSRARDGGIIKTISGDSNYRSSGVFNLELKTTSKKMHLEARMREAMKSCTYFNDFYFRKDQLAKYPFSVGVACLINQDLTFSCGAIVIHQTNTMSSKMVGEYYDEASFSKGIQSLLMIVNDQITFEGLSDYETYAPICDGVMGLPENEEEYPVYPLWESTPPPAPQPLEPSIEDIKVKYRKAIDQNFLLSNKLKPIAKSMLDLIDDSHASPYLDWLDYAKHLKAPLERVKRWIPLMAESEVFQVNKEKLGKAFKYQIALRKEHINEKN